MLFLNANCAKCDKAYRDHACAYDCTAAALFLLRSGNFGCDVARSLGYSFGFLLGHLLGGSLGFLLGRRLFIGGD